MNKLVTRKGQSIILNDNIRITVQEIKGKKVHLTIKAPDDVSVASEAEYFGEIMERVDKTVAEKKWMTKGSTKKSGKLVTFLQALREPLSRLFASSQ